MRTPMAKITCGCLQARAQYYTLTLISLLRIAIIFDIFIFLASSATAFVLPRLLRSFFFLPECTFRRWCAFESVLISVRIFVYII